MVQSPSPRANDFIIVPNERYILKDGLVVDAETAGRLGVEGEEFEHWVDPDEFAEAIFGLTPEQAREIRENVPSNE